MSIPSDDATARAVDLSVLVPVYNEEANVRPLHSLALPVLEGLGLSWEILFVDDGSSDGTGEALAEIRRGDPRVRVVRLRRNFGQTTALAAGFDHALGRRVVTMDGDLQNDPRDIPVLLRKMDEGYEVVSGWRRDRKEPFLTRRLPSAAANRLIASLSGVPIHDFGCTMKAYERSVFERLPLYAETHRFLPALASLTGARTAEVVVRHHARRAGRSKYGLSRIGKVLIDLLALQMILHFSTRPRRWFGALALPFALLGIACGMWTAIAYIERPAGAPMIVLPGATFLLFFLSFFLLSLGWFAELVAATGERERRLARLVGGSRP
ncbi:MAG: glycosyltransferase family 2 protein [Candidatus Eisenbacteria bacterium]